jgi:hypothetical protein
MPTRGVPARALTHGVQEELRVHDEAGARGGGAAARPAVPPRRHRACQQRRRRARRLARVRLPREVQRDALPALLGVRAGEAADDVEGGRGVRRRAR